MALLVAALAAQFAATMRTSEGLGRRFLERHGWDAAALVLAVGGVGVPQRALLLEIRVDLGQLDETANVVRVLLEDQPAAHMTGCYSGEPMEV